MQRTTTRPTADARSTAPGAAVEAVRLSNYDHWQGHSLRVTAVTPDGDVVLAERRYLGPGQSTTLVEAINAGDYEVRVRVDGVERARTTCTLDDTPAGTALVELGNGVVSLTTGGSAAT